LENKGVLKTAKVISEGIGTFSQHYPKVATIVTAQAKGKANAIAVAWHSVLSVNPPLYGVSIAPERLLMGEIVAVHWLEEAFTPEGTLDSDKISPVLFLGQDAYLPTAKDKVRHLGRQVYGKR